MKLLIRDLTAFCGLFCGDCIRYKCKASDLASQLSIELLKINFGDYAKVKRAHVKELESYEKMMSALDAICKLKCDTPCRLGNGGCVQSCEIAKCVRSKCIEGCWDCSDKEFEACDRFEFLMPFHGDVPRNNIKKIKEYGLDGWAEHREKCYRWL